MGFDDIDIEDQAEELSENNEIKYNKVINLTKHKESVHSSNDTDDIK